MKQLFKLIGVDYSAMQTNVGIKYNVIVGPAEGIYSDHVITETAEQLYLPTLEPKVDLASGITKNSQGNIQLWDVVHHGDALEILQNYPDNSVDLVFADPPYNLA